MEGIIKKSLRIKAIEPVESMAGAHFFNSSSFLSNKPFEIKGWQLIDKEPIAQIFFCVVNYVAISGYKSTFGSFDVMQEVIEDDLIWFLKRIHNNFKNIGIKEIEIRHFPAYIIGSDMIGNALIKAGYVAVFTEINQHITIEKLSFELIARRNEIKKVRQCENEGFQFAISSLDKLQDIYKLVVDTRQRKGYKVSMTFKELQCAVQANPDKYLLFTVFDGNCLIATSVSIVLNETTIYNFYHADDLNYRTKSPLTFLIKHIYTYCFNKNYKILDLGISSENGILNKGLYSFKKNLGAISGEKKLYRLKV